MRMSADQPNFKKYDDLEQKYLGLAGEMGLKQLVRYDAKLQRYFSTKAFEDQSPVMNIVDSYNESTFWDQLVGRLATRDLVRREGQEAVGRMTIEERHEKLNPGLKKYAAEIETSGLDNFELT